jgi:hypothetical protein
LWDSNNRYCYYCSCFQEPLQLVVPPTPSVER